jgi:hypothetical protein
MLLGRSLGLSGYLALVWVVWGSALSTVLTLPAVRWAGHFAARLLARQLKVQGRGHACQCFVDCDIT